MLFPVLVYKYWMAHRNNSGLSRLLMKPGLLLTTACAVGQGWPWAVLDELNISDRFVVLCVCKFGDLSKLKSLPDPQGPAHSLLKGKYFAKALTHCLQMQYIPLNCRQVSQR